MARFVEGNTSVDSPAHANLTVPLRELDDFTVARHVVVSSSPSNPGFSAFPHPSLVIFLSSSTPPVTARHCLQAPVCTYVYNNVTHTPRPRLFLLFRVAARGSKAGTARGRPGFDNRADVQDRDDKRGKEGGSEPCRGRYSMYIYMKKVKGKKGKERNRYLTLLWTDRTEGFT